MGWNRAEIGHGLQLLDFIGRHVPPGRAGGKEPGRYHLEALIAAERASAADTAGTDWARIAALYGEQSHPG
ncbi:hypothetical protein ACQP2P_12635 [Dactylosporangium sp. CA-139114]|uniref:hypothetical protein n=1 Tax=Dactylosporangium sp. CA-139114 TaxID=3239931 RepID=UPI003D98F85C